MVLRKQYLIGNVVAFGTLLIVLGLVQFQFGGVANAIRFVQGYDYAVSPVVIDLGSVTGGESETIATHVRNLSFSPIRVVGASTTCKCLGATGLPLRVAPRETADVKFIVYFGSTALEVKQMATILIASDGRMARVPVVVQGKVSTQGSPGRHAP